jgi:Mg-chelatase subunit ChlD
MPEDPTPYQVHGDEALEARIVAWVLGESSPFETDELKRLCTERPELEIFRRRIEAVHGLLGEAEKNTASLTWKLSTSRRTALNDAFGTTAITPANVLVPKKRKTRYWLSAVASLAILVALSGLFAPMAMRQRKSSSDMAAYSPKMMAYESASLEELPETAPMARREMSYSTEYEPPELPAPATDDLRDASLALLPNQEPQPSLKPSAPTSAQAEVIAGYTASPTPIPVPEIAAAERSLELTGTADALGGGALAQNDAPAPADMPVVGRLFRMESESILAPGESDATPAPAEKDEARYAYYDSQARDEVGDDNGRRTPPPASGPLTEEHRETVDQVRRNLYQAEGKMELGQLDDAKKVYEETLRIDPHNQAARRGMERVADAKSDDHRAAYDHTRAELLTEADKAWELAIPAEGKALDQSDPSDPSDLPRPQPPPPVPTNETSAAADPFSTFSLNVSDASFVIARDALRRGERPAAEQIRVEQFYNALDYGDPAPAAGEAVATHIEQTAHPVLPGRNLVRIASRVGSTGRAASQPLHLTLLVDQSGSMIRADRQAILASALATLSTLLGENDRIHLIGFARQPRLIAEALPGNRANEIPALIHQAAAEGGTNMEAALDLAQQIAARHHQPGAQNRVVILSDGAANLGDADPVRLAERITAMRQQGIATDIAGIGSDGLNDALLAGLARNGDGRYHIVTAETGPRLARDLAGAFRPAASDVKVQVVFNPDRVGGWKLIGFEEHRLNTEDFRNDAVDAAELAAEEAGVALYQVETLPQGRGEIGEIFIRFRDTTTGQIVERSWPIPYQPNTAALDQARPSMQLATLAMLTAEKLRGGPLGDAIDLSTHRPLIESLRPHFRNDPRANELFEMIATLTDR